MANSAHARVASAVVGPSKCHLVVLGYNLRHPRRATAALAAERVLGALPSSFDRSLLQITLQALKQAIGQVVGFPLDPWLSRADFAAARD